MTKMIKSLLERGVVEVINAGDLIAKLKSNKKLRIKFGIDPTNPNIHLGHTVPLRKLREFQKIGHQAVMIIGDWTAQIGDPSGRDKTRPPLSYTEIKTNAKQYTKQLFKIIDPSEAEVRWQSEWFNKFKLEAFFQLISQISAHELLSHETFQNRLKKHRPIAVCELMYPILQGYDSVVVKADVELGAIEQKFNLLMGRKIQKLLGQPEQNVIMMSYLTGTDGREKMSKSLGNTINLNDRPEDIYGKVMSIPDNLIIEYFTLCTDLTDKALEVVKDEVKVKPKEAKAQLAFLITETLYDTIQAEQAKERFDLIHRQHRLPQNIKQVRVNRSMPLGEIVARSGLVTSRSEAERVIIQGGVMLDNRVIKDWRKTITVSDGQVLKVGKRRFARLRV